MGPEDIKTVQTALTSGGYGLTALVGSLAWYLYRQLEAARKELVETIRADGVSQRDLLMQTVPLSTKLAEGIGLVSRALDKLEQTTSQCGRRP